MGLGFSASRQIALGLGVILEEIIVPVVDAISAYILNPPRTNHPEEIRRYRELFASILNEIYERIATAQSDSTSSDVAGIVVDFNSLLAKLRTAGLMST